MKIKNSIFLDFLYYIFNLYYNFPVWHSGIKYRSDERLKIGVLQM